MKTFYANVVILFLAIVTPAFSAPLPMSGTLKADGPAPAGSLSRRTDILNLVNTKRKPVSTINSGSTSADNIQISSVDETTSHSPDTREGYNGGGGLTDLLSGLLHP
ncbi:hypothetical protein K457DRAFT_138507 [Linnemannia elongata AG-77]|uniref:Uncharacterized protein n=1 Tax=Linnemannia elongata AG-77 TaxID=1314771 RepID=A0A197JUW4_9FUNG|nr:hypothetical protein K457DRAFT_138507 [Linnemannia elongata AG-77]